MTGSELDAPLRRELAGLAKENATTVARHLVVVGLLLDEDPETAYAHAMAARHRAGRVGSVREVAGVAAYRAGRYDEALAELRAARRITGSPAVLPMMADAERGLGRPERALALAASPEAATLDRAGRVEMTIVAAGARRDLGQTAAAVLALQLPELRARGAHPWLGRLRYAYADALAADGRVAEARQWFALAAEADVDGETAAEERLAELDGVVFVTDDEDDDPDVVPAEDPAEPTPEPAPDEAPGPPAGPADGDESPSAPPEDAVHPAEGDQPTG